MWRKMEEIFILNPLTALFLSGVATQLFVLVCDNDQRTTHNRKGLLKIQSDKRMDRWQKCFIKICMGLFDDHSFDFEKEQFQGDLLILDPFEVHLTLLTMHSEAMLYFLRGRNNTIGKNTLQNVRKWFQLMESLEKSWLGRKFDTTTFRSLIAIKNRFLSSTSTSTTHPTMLGKEYPHFSPGALFIRSAYVLHIHKHQFNPTQMDVWNMCNATFLSENILHLKDYFSDGSANCSMDNFSPIFPYISHLPCKHLYDVWGLSAQVSECVPLDGIFRQINICIIGNATTFHTHNHTDDDGEQMASLKRTLFNAGTQINKEMSLAKNCEKQKRHQNKKKGSQFENAYNTAYNTERSRPKNNPQWSCQFLFPYQFFDSSHFTSETFAC